MILLLSLITITALLVSLRQHQQANKLIQERIAKATLIIR